MLSLLEPNMMCLVQGFSGTKETALQEKRKKPSKLSILRRKKSPALSAYRHDDNLLHPNDAKAANFCTVLQRSNGNLGQDAALLTAQQSAAAAAAEALLSATPGSSKARQKKFHRHFKQVDPEERVLDYFSCALVADILLQGHLYITKNHFAFYSNVFGYTTKLLIPTASVLSVTKEKTAYIIPNAVGVMTEDEKHIFSSLLSRDSTYKLMVQVWSTAISTLPCSSITPPPQNKVEDFVNGDEKKVEEEESSLSSSESIVNIKVSAKTETPTLPAPETEELKTSLSAHTFKTSEVFKSLNFCSYSYISNLPLSTILLIGSTLLVVLLFLSASILLYRISRIQSSYNQEHVYASRSFAELQDFLTHNMENLYKVRHSLETLSLLIESDNEEKCHQAKWKS